MSRPINNHVLIRADSEIESALPNAGDGRWTLAVTGTIVAVPERLHYYGDELQNSRKKSPNYHPEELYRMRQWVKSSTEVETDLEVRPGDRVFFSYLVQNKKKIDGNILCHYDSLICNADTLWPFNGYLLVKMEEIPENAFGIYKDANRYGHGEVVHAGKCVRHRDEGADDPGIVVGSKIVFEKKKYVRLEVDQFKTTNEGGQSSLFRVRRKDVLTYH